MNLFMLDYARIAQIHLEHNAIKTMVSFVKRCYNAV